MSVSRPVRISRRRSEPFGASSTPLPGSLDRPRPAVPPATQLQRNRGGTLRAIRLATIYVVAIAVLYASLAAYGRSTPSGGSPGASAGLDVFGGLAIGVAAAGFLWTLLAAPRGVERRGTDVIVVGRFGGRVTLSAEETSRVRVVRRFPPGLLSPTPVVSVEILGGRFRRTYWLDEALLPH